MRQFLKTKMNKNIKGSGGALKSPSGNKTGLKNNKHSDRDECAICLEYLDDPKFGPTQRLDCTHRFHKACVKALRKESVQQVCPMCRAKLPDSAEKMLPIKKHLPLVLVLLLLLWLCQGFMYHHRRGVDVNYKKAIEWYEKAAEQGDADAQNYLGSIHYNGKNYKKAIEWYEIAAEQGDAHAQYNLGAIYQRGQGVERDYKKAAEWFEKAANHGHVDAQHIAGIMYYHGRGVDVNYKKAVEWFEKAAEQGHAKARRALHALGLPKKLLVLFVPWFFAACLTLPAIYEGVRQG